MKYNFLIYFFILFCFGCNSSKTEQINSSILHDFVKGKSKTLLFVYNLSCGGTKTFIPIYKKFDSIDIGKNVLFLNTGYSSINSFKHIKEYKTDNQPSIKISLFEKYRMNMWIKDNLVIQSNKQSDSIMWNWPMELLVDSNLKIIQVRPKNYDELIASFRAKTK